MDRKRTSAGLAAALLLAAVLCIGLAAPAVAMAGTTSIDVVQLGRPISGGYSVYARSNVRIYGPSGYYRSYWFAPRTSRAGGQTMLHLTGVPEGPYRISCDWYNMNGFFMAQDNRYTNRASTNWLGQYWTVWLYSR